MLGIMFLLGCAAQTGQHRQPEQKGGTQAGRRLMSGDGTLQAEYLLYLPEKYHASDKAWPLILFLHGAGERGDQLERVKVHGPPKRIENGEPFPFVIVSPQCPSGERWSVAVLDGLINDIIRRYRIDTSRIYLTGLSMGGFGTWAMAAAYPERFAAIAPICGGGDPSAAGELKDLPIWVFHGAKDGVVPLEKSREMVDAIREAGGNVKFTVYPDAGHDSWTVTYENPLLYEWFMKQKSR